MKVLLLFLSALFLSTTGFAGSNYNSGSADYRSAPRQAPAITRHNFQCGYVSLGKCIRKFNAKTGQSIGQPSESSGKSFQCNGATLAVCLSDYASQANQY